MTKNDAKAVDSDDLIAIVGMAVRVPGAENLDELWRLSVEGRDAVTRYNAPADVSADEYVPAIAEVSRLKEFDAEFFGMTPREARQTDPQHRIFLEESWHALEDAGLDPDRFDGDVAVFGSCAANAYIYLNVIPDPELATDIMLHPAVIQANDKDYMPVRAAYKLDLTGPAIAVQTACSSSLVGVVEAMDALLEYRCDAALVGGVSVKLPAGKGYRYVEGGFHSRTGYCRPFTAVADGTVFGTGAGVVVLRRLADALEDGDRVHAVLRGGAINNDGGERMTFTAPSVTGQTAVLAEALARADVDPDSVDLIEAHGTGTRLGDPIEIAAIDAAYGDRDTRLHPLHVSALKGSVGHLLAASGIVGLIRTALAVEHAVIPPVLGADDVNPIILASRTGAVFCQRAVPWPERESARRAGISSFGIGGTNAHVIIEQAPHAPGDGVPAPDSQWLGASAPTPAALDIVLTGLDELIQTASTEQLARIAGTLAHRRRAFPYRACALAHPGCHPEWTRTGAAFAGHRESGTDEISRWLAGKDVELPVPQPDRVADLPQYPFSGPVLWAGSATASDAVLSESRAGAAAELDAGGEDPTRVEDEVADMWSLLLGEELTDRSEHFLDQGGDSLTIAQLVTRIHERFPVRLDFADVMDHASVVEIAALVRERMQESDGTGSAL